MRAIQSEDDLLQVHRRGGGFVLNDFAGRGALGGQHNVLHVASCEWVPRSNVNVPKLYFGTLAEAVAWLERERGPEDVNWKRCGSCRAEARTRVAGSRTRAAGGGRPPDTAKVLGDEFLIRGVEPSRSVVEAWSATRLQFQPQGWQREFRQSLRAALSGLFADHGSGLYALYASSVTDLVDLENVLFYNVSSSAFSHIARERLCFERKYSEAPDGGHRRTWPHYQRYSMEKEPRPWRAWRPAALLAEFGPTYCEPLHEFTKVSPLWYALRTGSRQVPNFDSAGDGYFGVRIEVTGPRHRNLAAIVKPVFDAAIAAFQAHADIETASEISARIGTALGLPAAHIAELLLERSTAALGTGRLAWPRADGVQWNPADERCVAGELVSTIGDRWSLRGELLGVHAAHE